MTFHNEILNFKYATLFSFTKLEVEIQQTIDFPLKQLCWHLIMLLHKFDILHKEMYDATGKWMFTKRKQNKNGEK